MAITVRCPGCDVKMSAPDAAAGRRLKCPACQTAIEIPAAGESTKSPGATATNQPSGSAPSLPSSGANAGTPGNSGKQVSDPGTSPARPKPRTRSGGSSGLRTRSAKNAPVRDEWLVLTADGQQYGPITRADLDMWVQENRLDRQSQVYCHGWPQWRWASEVYPDLTGPASSPESPDPFTGVDNDPPPADNPFAGIGEATPQAGPTFDIPAVEGERNLYESPTATTTTTPTPISDKSQNRWQIVGAGLQVSEGALIVSLAGFALLVIGMLYFKNVNAISLLTSSRKGAFGYFVGILSVWGMIAASMGAVAFVTTWFVFLNVPRESGARNFLRYGLIAVAGSLACVALASLLPLTLAGADPKTYEELRDLQETAEVMRTVTEMLTWLSFLASFASSALFALFLREVARYASHRALEQMAMFFAMFIGIAVVWFTVDQFALSNKGKTMRTVTTVLFAVIGLVQLGGLLCITRMAHDLVRRKLAKSV